MKRGKRPTRAQKILISSARLSAANWLVTGENQDDITIVHKNTGSTRTIKKK